MATPLTELINPGEAVVRALLKDGTFKPRAIVRNPESATAIELKELGAELVQGDSLNKTSLVSALRGSEAVFAVTVPLLPLKAEGEGPNEIVQGKNMVDAAKEVGVKFFIFSSLPHMTKFSNGKYPNCIHYDQKSLVEEYLQASGLANASLLLGAFLENYWKFGLLKKTATGFSVTMPHSRPTDLQTFSWIERDLPAAALALLKNYTDPTKNVSGKSYPIVNARISYGELAAETAKALAYYGGLYHETPIPNPDLVALGVRFGTIEEFLQDEVKPRFGQ
ncbi:hypothetical protein C8R43DRAFT_1092448 [Mycena crocata]|nr:hypothetical protein C8R43DRAFT_1092448 [Mycena crocata]